jgi:hypothetical protein
LKPVSSISNETIADKLIISRHAINIKHLACTKKSVVVVAILVWHNRRITILGSSTILSNTWHEKIRGHDISSTSTTSTTTR